MKSAILSLLLAATMGSVYAQGEVTIHKDNRINNLVKKKSEVIPPATSPQIDGYRLQLFFDSDKQKIDKARISFLAQFPKVETYVTYSAPNYFLRVGDFRTKLEAEKIKSEVEQEFPTSFVLKEKINLPRIQ